MPRKGGRVGALTHEQSGCNFPSAETVPVVSVMVNRLLQTVTRCETYGSCSACCCSRVILISIRSAASNIFCPSTTEIHRNRPLLFAVPNDGWLSIDDSLILRSGCDAGLFSLLIIPLETQNTISLLPVQLCLF